VIKRIKKVQNAKFGNFKGVLWNVIILLSPIDTQKCKMTIRRVSELGIAIQSHEVIKLDLWINQKKGLYYYYYF